MNIQEIQEIIDGLRIRHNGKMKMAKITRGDIAVRVGRQYENPFKKRHVEVIVTVKGSRCWWDMVPSQAARIIDEVLDKGEFMSFARPKRTKIDIRNWLRNIWTGETSCFYPNDRTEFRVTILPDGPNLRVQIQDPFGQCSLWKNNNYAAVALFGSQMEGKFKIHPEVHVGKYAEGLLEVTQK